MASKKSAAGDAWYSIAGEKQEVVLSSSARLFRNLANFPFSPVLQDSDGERIQSIMFDCFNKMDDADKYQIVAVKKLDDIGSRVMRERDILGDYEGNNAGIILRNDGKISCTVNTGDHVVVSSFCSGFGIEESTRNVYDIDLKLQKYVQFAASYDFGYLTRHLLNSGSGLCLSSVVHLPACCLTNSILELSEKLGRDGFVLSDRYGSAGNEAVSGFNSMGSALGSCYRITTRSSAGGTEIEQMASMEIAVKNVVAMELAARKTCRAEHLTEIVNFAYRSLALANCSLFVSLKEAVEIVNGVKFGLDMGILSGIDDSELHALLYRIQEGHLEYVLNSGKFKFEKDIQKNKRKQIERLRALILQEAFENVEK